MSDSDTMPINARDARVLAGKHSSQSTSDPLQGSVVLKHYRINSKLARGGMSNVFLARRVDKPGLYAIKVLHPDLVAEPRIRERVLNESKAVQRIDHPAVISLFDVGEISSGQICLVMEYVHGFSLRRFMRKESIPIHRAVTLLASVCEGLAAAHCENVIHRDLKPENVLVPRDGGTKSLTKLIDFGIARIIDAPSITTTQHVMGTPEYIAPEQAMGEPVDHRADIYSMGVMMYEMFSGSLPFTERDPETLLHKHISTPPPPLRATYMEQQVLPRNLVGLIMGCLAKAPWNRPQHITEVLDVLKEIS